MKYFFCTLFDSNYLTRGLAMYESLNKHCSNFHLYIFPFDDEAYKVLETLKLNNVTLIPLKDFEDEKLLSVKPYRSKGEYCWTSTSSTILYTIEKFNIDHCIYLDADLYFFNSPEILLEEVKDKSILITDHRYSPEYNRAYDCGKYCVQFIFFRNDENGIKALKWWRNACLEWCYNRLEDGKFGDQKYLDDWLTRFDKVCELKHLGGGVAPWNIQQYMLENIKNTFYISDSTLNSKFPLVFYHFHELKFLYKTHLVHLCGYFLPADVKGLLYQNYLKHLLLLQRQIISISKQTNGQEFKKMEVKNIVKLFLISIFMPRRNIKIIYGRNY